MPYSTMTLPRNMPIRQANSYSPGSLGEELHGDGFPLRKARALVEGGQQHHLRARGRFLADEVQPDRLAGLHHDHVGGVSPFTRSICSW